MELHPAASSTVTVDYRTEDRSATAPADYQATSGTLTFARGETAKTVSVPIVDDTVEDSGESFALLLSNVPGARLGVERAAGLIYNHEDVLAGFTLVDAAAGTDVGSLTDGTEVTLDAPATGQYGVRVETIPEAAIGSLRLALSGAKTGDPHGQRGALHAIRRRRRGVADGRLHAAGDGLRRPRSRGHRAADALGVVHGRRGDGRRG